MVSKVCNLVCQICKKVIPRLSEHGEIKEYFCTGAQFAETTTAHTAWIIISALINFNLSLFCAVTQTKTSAHLKSICQAPPKILAGRRYCCAWFVDMTFPESKSKVLLKLCMKLLTSI